MSISRNPDPDYYIPIENVDEPLEYFTQQNNKMKKGDKVLITTTRPYATEMNGKEGTITAIDSADNRTIFPYYVEVNGYLGGWFKENEVSAVAETPKDNAPGFITIIALLVVGFYGMLAACNAPAKPSKTPDTLQYLSPGQIPTDNLKDTVGGANNG